MALNRHTNRVKFLRGTLPVLAVLGLVVVVAWPIVNEYKDKARALTKNLHLSAEEIALTAPAAGVGPQLQVIKPEFSGLDDAGHPYTVTATRVLQGLSMNTPMTLDKPAASMTLDKEKNQTAQLNATSGVYDPAAKTLSLDKDVTLTHSDGYTLQMQDLYIDLANGVSTTKTPVVGNGPLGHLEGQELELRDKGQHIILHGRSKLILTPQKNS